MLYIEKITPTAHCRDSGTVVSRPWCRCECISEYGELSTTTVVFALNSVQSLPFFESDITHATHKLGWHEKVDVEDECLQTARIIRGES